MYLSAYRFGVITITLITDVDQSSQVRQDAGGVKFCSSKIHFPNGGHIVNVR